MHWIYRFRPKRVRVKASQEKKLPATNANQIQLLQDVIEMLFSSVEPPSYIEFSENEAGFRFGSPTPFHFCILKLGRAVSTLNAVSHLYERSFTQEIFTLVRILSECTTHAEYVAQGVENGQIKEEVFKYVEAYFNDARRARGMVAPRNHIRQEKINKAVGRFTDEAKDLLDKDSQLPEDIEDLDYLMSLPSSQLMSDVYRTFSNYVHARYPETMDMFGGRASAPHLNGMLGTPKDQENLETITMFITAVSNAAKLVIFKFGVEHLIESERRFSIWLRSGF